MDKTKLISIVILIAITLAVAVSAQGTTQRTCPPDIAIKWYAFVNYLAYATGQNASQLIAQAQTRGNFTVTVSGVEVTVPYCSLNATATNGSRMAVMPAVGVGELKKLGLNITQAKVLFQKLKEARDEAMRNLTKYIRPLESVGLDAAAKALAEDKGYERAIAINANMSAVLKAVAQLLARVGANETAVREVLRAAEIHNETASLLSYIREMGGVGGIRRGFASNLTAVVTSDRGYSALATKALELAVVFKSLASNMAKVNSTLSQRLLGYSEVFNKTAVALMYIRTQGGMEGMTRGALANATAALNGTYGIQNAIIHVEESIKRLNETLEVLKSVNASSTAIEKVQKAMELHEKALEVLTALEGVGGAVGLEQNVYGALESGQELDPNVVALCLQLNVTDLLAKYGTSALQIKYATICEVAKLLEYYRRGVFSPMYLTELRGIISGSGGLKVFENPYLAQTILSQIVELEQMAGIKPSSIVANMTRPGRGR
ncbi:MAG: hypothetical protein QXP98_01505 [Thermoproteus sp.]